MHMLSLASGIDASAEHMHKELLCAMSISVRYLCMHWAFYAWGCVHCAYASGTYHALSICVKNLCGCWIYALFPLGYAQHNCNNSKLEKGPLKTSEHMQKEQKLALNINIKNLCICSVHAYKQLIKRCLSPIKWKYLIHILAPKTHTRKGLWLKNHENQNNRKPYTWAPLISSLSTET